MTNKPYSPFTFLFLISLSWLSSSIANANATIDNETLRQKVSQAISKFEQTKRENWAYKVTRYENEEGDVTSSIELFDPSTAIEKQWQLLRINGKTPSSKQVKRFTKKKLKQAKEKNKNNNYSIPLRELINLESLKLVDDNNSHITMSFDVYLEKLGEQSRGKLTGNLSYNKRLAFIEDITIVNKAEFSPVFSAKITDFKLAFNFANYNDSILPQQQNMEMKGTFAFFTEINEVSTDTYSNYNFYGIN